MAEAGTADTVRTPAEAVRWLRAHAPAHAQLCTDSRRVAPGDIFVSLHGRRSDGLDYVQAAQAAGAAAVVADAANLAGRAPLPLPTLGVTGLAAQTGAIAAAFYGDPSAQLRVVGITGTNGKTSSCVWVAQLLEAAGQHCATLGTLGYGFPGAIDAQATGLTTPDAVSVHRLARAALDAGARALAMEVSSIGLDQGRVDAMHFDVALFTNLTRDHLDYHGDFQAYGASKRRLFTWRGLRHAVINLDDDFGVQLATELSASGLAVTGVATRPGRAPGLRLDARLLAVDSAYDAQGLQLRVRLEREGGTQEAQLSVRLLGGFNVANLLGVLGVGLACGLDLPTVARCAAGLVAPPGRLESVQAPGAATGPLAIVDYAHTPDAIARALEAVRPLAAARGGRLWIVFGAGGDRDRGKRPVMAAAAAAGADQVVVTSDNPRSENPSAILDDIVAGLPPGVSCLREVDRARAIAAALDRAAPADIVLIAGKGHEDYQEIAGQRHPFSDQAVARAALQQRAERRP